MRLASAIAVLAPFLAAITFIFGALQIYLGFVALRAGSVTWGLFYAVFGIAGIALAMAIWSLRKQFRGITK